MTLITFRNLFDSKGMQYLQFWVAINKIAETTSNICMLYSESKMVIILSNTNEQHFVSLYKYLLKMFS